MCNYNKTREIQLLITSPCWSMLLKWLRLLDLLLKRNPNHHMLTKYLLNTNMPYTIAYFTSQTNYLSIFLLLLFHL